MADKGKAKNITDFKVEKRDGGDLLITINDPEIVRHISEVAAKVFSEYASDIDPYLVYIVTETVLRYHISLSYVCRSCRE